MSCAACDRPYPCSCVACPQCDATAAYAELGHVCTACDWRSDRCDCGALMTFAADMRGTSCGGLALVGFRACVPCGVYEVCRKSRPADAVDWKLANGGRSINAGGIRIRAEAAKSEDGDPVPDLMARLVRFPELELELSELRALVAKREKAERRHACPCPHDLVEVLSTNGRNLDGAIRRCARCGERVAA